MDSVRLYVIAKLFTSKRSVKKPLSSLFLYIRNVKLKPDRLTDLCQSTDSSWKSSISATSGQAVQVIKQPKVALLGEDTLMIIYQ